MFYKARDLFCGFWTWDKWNECKAVIYFRHTRVKGEGRSLKMPKWLCFPTYPDNIMWQCQELKVNCCVHHRYPEWHLGISKQKMKKNMTKSVSCSRFFLHFLWKMFLSLYISMSLFTIFFSLKFLYFKLLMFHFSDSHNVCYCPLLCWWWKNSGRW